MPKIPEISVGIQMERSVSVSSDRFLLEVVHIFRSEFAVRFLTNGFFALIREFGKRIQNDESHFYWLARFNRKCRSIFLRYSHWSLTGLLGIMESTHGFHMMAQSQLIADDRRRCLWSSVITIAGPPQTIAEVCFHMIADDRRTFCDLRSAIICNYMETGVYFKNESKKRNCVQCCHGNHAIPPIFTVYTITRK